MYICVYIILPSKIKHHKVAFTQIIFVSEFSNVLYILHNEESVLTLHTREDYEVFHNIWKKHTSKKVPSQSLPERGRKAAVGYITKY